MCASISHLLDAVTRNPRMVRGTLCGAMVLGSVRPVRADAVHVAERRESCLSAVLRHGPGRAGQGEHRARAVSLVPESWRVPPPPTAEELAAEAERQRGHRRGTAAGLAPARPPGADSL